MPLDVAGFLLEDYRQKVNYLTAHFQRMWTRFNFFVTIETALVAFVFTSNRDLTSVAPIFAAIGMLISVIWYVLGAQDRFLVLVYRQHVEDTGSKLVELVKLQDPPYAEHLTDYIHVGEFKRTAESLAGKRGCFQWYSGVLSITRLAAIFPFIIGCLWTLAFIALLLYERGML
jgi:hypothetical protein